MKKDATVGLKRKTQHMLDTIEINFTGVPSDVPA
jgi:hypothetical protein